MCALANAFADMSNLLDGFFVADAPVDDASDESSVPSDTEMVIAHGGEETLSLDAALLILPALEAQQNGVQGGGEVLPSALFHVLRLLCSALFHVLRLAAHILA